MPERNHLIDLARVGSVLVVIIFHSLLWVVQVDQGQLVVYPWAPGPVLWAASWVFTIVPVFFVAAGYANAVVVDKWRATGAPYAAFLTLRGSRLLGPMTLYMAFFTLVGTVAAWAGWLPQASALSRQFAQLLWFAVVYQVLLGLAPVAVWLHDRFGGWVMLPLLAGAIAVDAAVRITGNQGLQWLSLAFVWPLAHQWGIAYHRGWFRGWSTVRLTAALTLAAAVIVALVGWLHYPPAAVAWADVLVANLLPPTLAIVALGWAQACVLGLLEKVGVARTLAASTARAVQITNALLLTAYLWHIPAIVAAAGALAGVSLLVPGLAPVLMHQITLVVAVLALVAAVVPQIARVEWLLIPTAGSNHPTSRQAEFSYALFTIGTWAIWQLGAVIHPGDPGSTVAIVVFATGAALLHRTTTATARVH